MNGESIYIPVHSIDLGVCEANSRVVPVFSLRNLATKDIKIVGCDSCCGCNLASRLPLLIPAGKTVNIKVNVDMPSDTDLFEPTITLMVADPNQLVNHTLYITATIHKEPEIPTDDNNEPCFSYD